MSKPTMDQMREHIMNLMLNREWNPGVSHKQLATKWGCATRTVADRALEANRVIRTIATRDKSNEDFVHEKLVELDSIAARSMAIDRPRDAIAAIELQAKLRGAMAPTRVQDVAADNALSDDELLAKLTEATAQVRARIEEKRAGKNGAGVH